MAPVELPHRRDPGLLSEPPGHPTIVCRTLGPVDVTIDGVPAPSELLWRKHLALLIYLARSPRQSRSREHLVGLLWGDRTELAARHSLSEALRVIRRCAGSAIVEVTVGHVGLAPGTVELDVDRLSAHRAAGEWEEAAALVVGDFLEGFAVPDASAFEDWLAAERAAWRLEGIEVLVRRSAELARTGRAQEATAMAARAQGLDPASEPALQAALRAHALAGDRAGALERYDRFRAELAEMGLEPSEATRAVAERVRRERNLRLDTRGEGPDDAAVARPPLGGRADELDRLLEGAARAGRTGRAVLLMLEGEPGIGKSRLLSEMLALLRLDGAPTASARAVEGDRVEPWSGVLALLRGGLLDAPGVAAAPGASLAAIAAVLPEWGERFRGAASAADVPLGRAMADVVRAVAAERPVVLAVDDAQWLDPDSALAIGAMVRDLADAPVTLVLAVAPHPPRAELDELRSRIGRDVEGGAVRLRRLDREALRWLAERMLTGYDALALDRVVRRVARDSAGLPLLAVELLRAVALGLDLGKVAGTWPAPLRTLDHSLPGDLPDAVVAAIRVAVRRLSPTAQRVLAATAALGDVTAPPVLERVLGLPADELGRALDELEWHRWLASEPRGYSFVARIVRQVVAQDMLTPGQRRRIVEAAGG